MKQFIHKVVASSSSACLWWLRNYLELLTLCVNIPYNVTLNMQICTAQHLISHLSVKVPSVGSPVGPALMSRRAPDRNMREEGEETRAAGNCERERGRTRGQETCPRCVWLQIGGGEFCLDWEEVKKHKRKELESPENENWMEEWRRLLWVLSRYVQHRFSLMLTLTAGKDF